jgi:hypothetical protein
MTDTMTDALRRAREAIASLPEDALGMAQIGFGGPEDVYPIRDELLSEIDAALASTPTVADDGKLVERLEKLEAFLMQEHRFPDPVPDEVQSEIRLLFNEALAGGPNMNGDAGPTLAHNHALDCVWATKRIAALATRLEQPSGMREALEEVRNFAANRTNEAPGFGLIVRAIDHALSQQHKGDGGE